MKTSKLKQMPVFKTDAEAENFVDFELLLKKAWNALDSLPLTDEEFTCLKPAKEILPAAFF
ncbi:hypothetical protein [Bartonella sp. B17]